MIRYYSHKPLPPVLTYGEVETCCSGVNGVRGFLWILQLLLGLFLSEQPVVRQHRLLPPAITPCLSLPLDMQLGTVPSRQHGQAPACACSCWGKYILQEVQGPSILENKISGSTYLQANEAGLPACTPTLSLTLCSLLGW